MAAELQGGSVAFGDEPVRGSDGGSMGAEAAVLLLVPDGAVLRLPQALLLYGLLSAGRCCVAGPFPPLVLLRASFVHPRGIPATLPGPEIGRAHV